ncbi:hypothetical protein PBI_ARISSANAE_70 [Mycobacterium phage Arissanae]|nr:hypothetical protein PBI_ARISSANAE_70 [Mycobacterium phage Arissanae]
MGPVKPSEYGPDNPRLWDPNHPTLRSRGAPHETVGLLRFHRAGYSGQFLMRAFRVGAQSLAKVFEQGMEAENNAARQQRDIHCPTTDPEKRKGKA